MNDTEPVHQPLTDFPYRHNDKPYATICSIQNLRTTFKCFPRFHALIDNCRGCCAGVKASSNRGYLVDLDGTNSSGALFEAALAWAWLLCWLRAGLHNKLIATINRCITSRLSAGRTNSSCLAEQASKLLRHEIQWINGDKTKYWGSSIIHVVIYTIYIGGDVMCLAKNHDPSYFSFWRNISTRTEPSSPLSVIMSTFIAINWDLSLLIDQWQVWR